jgi:hypothetical protein
LFFFLGLTDAANNLAVQAQQTQSGATNTTCSFASGGTNNFDFDINTSSETYNASLKAGSFATQDAFHQALATFFRTKLTTIYTTQISSVTFLSIDITGGVIDLKFRVNFTNAVTNTSARTAVVSNIQSVYYQLLTSYFPSVAKTMNVPTQVSIPAPTDVATTSKKAVVTAQNASQSILNGGSVTVTKVSTSSKYMR